MDAQPKDVSLPKLDFLSPHIPIPDPSYLKKIPKTDHPNDGKLVKYEKEYEKFCEWYALPVQVRSPKTQDAFEKKWKLPRSYSFEFKRRSDFRNKVLNYFWDWMLDKLPDVVYGQYLKATDKGDTNAAKFFGELVGKKLDAQAPQRTIQPFMLVGVPQEKINKLFTPEKYEKIGEIIPEETIK